MKRNIVLLCLSIFMFDYSCQSSHPTKGDSEAETISTFFEDDADTNTTLVDFDYTEVGPAHEDSSENEIPNVIINGPFGVTGSEDAPPTSEGKEDFECKINWETPEDGPLPDFFDEGAIDRLCLNQKVDYLFSEVKKQRERLSMLEKVNAKLQAKVDFIEDQTKTNSLIFFNVPENKRETYSTTLKKVLHVINRLMKVNLSSEDVSVALRAATEEEVNSTRQKRQNRPILVRFTQFSTKMKVLSARRRLPARSRITVESDYSERVASTRAQLQPYLRLARARGHYAFILYDRIVIDGKKHTLRDLQTEVSGQQGLPDEQVEMVDVDPEHQDNEDEE